MIEAWREHTVFAKINPKASDIVMAVLNVIACRYPRYEN